MSIRVLVVDDELILSAGVIYILKDIHPEWEYQTARDGLDAVRKAIKFTPDLILMDFRMPKLNGLDSIKHIKKHLPETRFIMVYALMSDVDITTAISYGVSGFVLKGYPERGVLSI